MTDTTSTMKLLDVKTSLTTINLIKQAGKKLDERIHLVACSGLQHFYQHGDTTALTALARAMPKSARGNALKAWVTRYANVRFDSKAFAGAGGYVKAKGKVQQDLDGAMDNPFYNAVDKTPTVYNPETRTRAFIAGIRKALRDGDMSADDLAVVQDKVGSLTA